MAYEPSSKHVEAFQAYNNAGHAFTPGMPQPCSLVMGVARRLLPAFERLKIPRVVEDRLVLARVAFEAFPGSQYVACFHASFRLP